MKKSLSLLMMICLLSCPVLAQEMDLFPELRGRFKPAEEAKPAPEVKPQEQPVIESLPSNEGYAQDEDTNTPTVPASYVPPTKPMPINPDNFQGQQKEGNVTIQLTNLKGVLPYARNFSYCFADAVLTNQTNQTLQELHIVLTYQGSRNDLRFGGIPQKGQQVQKLMMNGPECESILSMPELDIPTCKMENQSEDACKKRIQFMTPNE